ncbi:CDP-diacylglycerol--serine O-phosphatidyltransferase [Saccharibacillus sp. VR-M41]|uniref:CDP-diacylglycerol--serine O-phosphatidyltransferase n=2 Tax=Saccharibacillus alkalitolerans TaxID=2705290 RepID=A0ABX0FCP2_9BACL|nr:CDP-diacylglycerol--serine O-phosphatidyltransferase [Saccharibacillus alkalitolerans]
MLTLGNLLLGFAAILLIFQDQKTTAVLLILLGLVCDFFDGFCARKLNAESALGKELDSLADLVTFGVAPAMLVYASALQHMSVLGAVCCLVYVACSALRLARFNAGQSHMCGFVGMPTPMAAVILILLTVTANPPVLAVGVCLTSMLMVSRLSFPSLKKIKPEVVEDC